MTEYWVSQGNKWCDTCKIFISNNPSSIRNHELGQRHKDNVTKRLNTMREDKAAKDKEHKQAARVMEQIEAKAKRSYQKDLATFEEARESNAHAITVEDFNQGAGSAVSGDWEFDSSTGYYYNKTNSCYYDPNSGFYYTDALGKWVTQEDALVSFQVAPGSAPKRPGSGKPPPSASSSQNRPDAGGPPPGRVVSTLVNPTRQVKGATSSVAFKRKRPVEKPKAMTKEEADALKARAAARKRVEEREKSLLGLYKR